MSSTSDVNIFVEPHKNAALNCGPFSKITLPLGISRFVKPRRKSKIPEKVKAGSKILVWRGLTWCFDGSIFDDLTKDKVELNSMIQELISTKSKFGLKNSRMLIGKMASYCRYCPPPHFNSHVYCHTQSIRYRINIRKIKTVKENISERNLIFIAQKKLKLNKLFNHSNNDNDFRKLAIRVRRFNNVVEHFLENFWTGLNGRMIFANLSPN